jgi:hypothetical protein
MAIFLLQGEGRDNLTPSQASPPRGREKGALLCRSAPCNDKLFNAFALGISLEVIPYYTILAVSQPFGRKRNTMS